eukprot:TRINITY_DN11398_c0_g1_i1.p1 TRINITY_DN11398_c0_g1~~TRINITY_DN11398_c0_g1_i1.p1  ORF type:complete len:414 (+),score=97.70 TRINITY_DN11398_c0_g1_i1:112-1353(+)
MRISMLQQLLLPLLLAALSRARQASALARSAASAGAVGVRRQSAGAAAASLDSALHRKRLPAWLVTTDEAAASRGRAAPALTEGGIPYGSGVNPPKYLDLIISPIFVDRRPETGSFLGCFPCKNGMSWWTSFSCQVDPHCAWTPSVGDAARLYRLPEAARERALADASIPRFVIARNPLIRALSGFLTWVDQDNPYNYVPPTFDGFVRKLEAARLAYPTSETYTWARNPHWRLQREYCGLNHGQRFHVYKAERRSSWGAALLTQLGGQAYLRAAKGLNFSLADQPNGDGENCPGYHCHAKAIMAQYYTPELFDLLQQYYWDDIVEFHYRDDVEQLRKALFPDASSAPNSTITGDGPLSLMEPAAAAAARRQATSVPAPAALPRHLRDQPAGELARALDAASGVLRLERPPTAS